MNTSKLLALAILSLSVGLAAAQPAPEPRVTAVGVGEFLAAPDMVIVTVEAVNNDDSPLDAAADTRKDMAAMVAAARKQAKGPTDLRTTRISINPEYEWVDGKRKFRGYNASQTLEVTLRDVSKVDSLLSDLVRSPLKNLGNLEFRHSKSDSLNRIALALAVRNADANAKAICAAAGRACSEPVSIRMGGAGPGPMPVHAVEFKAARADVGSIPVQPGVLSFGASVEADYRLTPSSAP